MTVSWNTDEVVLWFINDEGMYNEVDGLLRRYNKSRTVATLWNRYKGERMGDAKVTLTSLRAVVDNVAG